MGVSKAVMDRALSLILDAAREVHQNTCSQADDTTINLLDAQSAALRELKAHIDQRLAIVASQRNANVAANSLPAEVTTMILRAALTPRAESNRVPRALARVQSSWSQIIRRCFPEYFWLTIRMKYWNSPADVENMLDKSWDLPLKVIMNELIDGKEDPFFLLLTPHLHRIKALETKRLGHGTLQPFLQTPGFSLRQIHVEAARSVQEVQLLDIDTKPLRDVTVSRISIPFAHLSNLTALSIAHLPSSVVTLTTIMDILRSSSQIESLVLEDIIDRPSLYDEPPLIAQKTVVLPNLHEVRLYGITAHIVVPLLRSIEADGLQTLRVFDSGDIRFTALIIPTLTAPSLLLSHLRGKGLKTLKLGFWEHTAILTSQAGASQELRLTMGGDVASYLTGKSLFSPPEFLWDIDLDPEGWRVDPGASASWWPFEGMPNVVSLTMVGLPFMNQLSQAGQAWPRLAKVTFDARLRRSIGKRDWKRLMKALALFVKSRQKVPGISPVQVFDENGRQVLDIAKCPRDP